MLVRDVMHRSPKCCSRTTNLAAVTELLWSGGCGAIPVMNEDGALAGIITDRDICVALGTRNTCPSLLYAGDVMSCDPVTCRSSDEIHAALEAMRSHKVRRLPVLSEDGRLEGMLSMSDLILAARHRDNHRPLSYEDVMATLKGIYSHHNPVAPRPEAPA